MISNRKNDGLTDNRQAAYSSETIKRSPAPSNLDVTVFISVFALAPLVI